MPNDNQPAQSYITTVLAEAKAKRACETLAARILGAMK